MNATPIADDYLAATIRRAEADLAVEVGLPSAPVEHVLSISGTLVRVLEFKGRADLPPVVLLHGLASVTAAAFPLIASLGQRRVLAVDWPGHGLSTAFELSRSAVRRHAIEVVETVATQFGPDPFDLLGHTMGGQFGLYFALARPDRVRRLVLLGCPGPAVDGVHLPFAFRVASVPGVGRWVLSRPTTLEQYRATSRELYGSAAVAASPEAILVAGHAAYSRSGFPRSLASFLRAMITPFAVTPSELRGLRMPVLAVWGEEDVFLHPERARSSLDSIARLRLVMTSGGHAPWLDEPEVTAGAVCGFLDEPDSLLEGPNSAR
jgi:pimeloyl-ACP methyl ester carboxylesterase